jgi:hypothetical protein
MSWSTFSPGTVVGFGARNRLFRAPHECVRGPEVTRPCGGVAIPGLRLRLVSDEGGDENVQAVFLLRLLEDDDHCRTRFGLSVLDEPGEPETLGALCEHDLIVRPRGDADRLTDLPTEIDFLDEKRPSVGAHASESIRQQKAVQFVGVGVGVETVNHHFPRIESSEHGGAHGGPPSWV